MQLTLVNLVSLTLPLVLVVAVVLIWLVLLGAVVTLLLDSLVARAPRRRR